jgi:hypothetical protein
LRELVAAGVAQEEEKVALHRIDAARGHRLLKERQLPPHAQRGRHLVELGGVAEPGGDQHFHSCRMPARKPGCPGLGVVAHGLDEGQRDRRHALDDEVGAGAKLIRTTERDERQEDEDRQRQGFHGGKCL